MERESKKVVQLVLTVALVTAAVRLVLIYQERHSVPSTKAAKSQQPLPAQANFNADYYVTPKKLYLYDVTSARRELTNREVWIREGYRYVYYPVDPSSHRVDFKRDAGQLLSLEKLQINNVFTTPPPERDAQPQIVATFTKNGKPYALPIGALQGAESTIHADQMLFYEDPRVLYKHWLPETWQAIDQHEVKVGMNELQVSFAVGMGVPQASSAADVKVVEYPNGGNKVIVTYRAGKAAEIRRGS